jgi:hypothetical protein
MVRNFFSQFSQDAHLYQPDRVCGHSVFSSYFDRRLTVHRHSPEKTPISLRDFISYAIHQFLPPGGQATRGFVRPQAMGAVCAGIVRCSHMEDALVSIRPANGMVGVPRKVSEVISEFILGDSAQPPTKGVPLCFAAEFG